MISRPLSISLPRRWLEEKRQLWLRLLVIAGVLLASAYLAPRASQRLLILLLGGGMSLVFLRWPPLGLATLIVASMVVPFAIGTGTQTSLNVTALLLPVLMGLWALDMVRRRKLRPSAGAVLRLLPSRPIPPLLALSIVAVLAFAAGNLPWFFFAQTASLPAQLGGLAVYLLSAGAFLLVAHQVRGIRWLQRLTWLFLALGGLFIAGRLVPGLGRFTGRLFQRGATGSLFWVWLVALAFSQAAFNRDLHPGWRLALGVLVMATFYVGLFLNRSWASGWLPPLIALGVILWLRFPRLAPLCEVSSVMFLAFRFSTFLHIVVSDAQGTLFPWEARLAAWQIMLEVVKTSPILGLGPSNYYHYVQLYPIMGYYVQFNSHNNYFDLIAQTGLLGLGFFLWFALAVWREGWSLRSRVEDGFSRGYVCACLGGLVGTLAAGMLGDWFLPFVYNIGIAGFRSSVLFWLFLGGLVSLKYQAIPESGTAT